MALLIARLYRDRGIAEARGSTNTQHSVLSDGPNPLLLSAEAATTLA
jgi:hypothetical protein